MTIDVGLSEAWPSVIATKGRLCTLLLPATSGSSMGRHCWPNSSGSVITQLSGSCRSPQHHRHRATTGRGSFINTVSADAVL